MIIIIVHAVYQELVQLLASECLQLVHCAYECPSVMDSVKVDYSKRDTINVGPVVGFDWYATGYCISHFDERWGLVMRHKSEEDIDLLVKGLRSSSIAKGRNWSFDMYSSSLSVIITLREFSRLKKLGLWSGDIDHDDLVILQQLIAPGSELKSLFIFDDKFCISSLLIPAIFQPSSLQEIILFVGSTSNEIQLLPHGNTNLKRLTITHDFLHLLAAFIMNCTSLTYLKIGGLLDRDDLPDLPDLPISVTYYLLDSGLPVLTNIVQSHPTLEELEIYKILNYTYSINLLQLIEAAE